MSEETIRLRREFDAALRGKHIRGGMGGPFLYAAITDEGATFLSALFNAGWAADGPDFGAGTTYAINPFFLALQTEAANA